MSVKALQDYTFVSKYARYVEDQKRRETWTESIERVRDMHLRKYPQISKEIQWAFEQSRQKRILGSQRALQFGGKPIEKKNARIFNCIASYCDRLRFFQECFWLLLCGCGTGFSVQRHHIDKLPDFSPMWMDLYKCLREDNGRSLPQKVYIIPDTIEGWADALGVLMSSFCGEGDFPEYEGYDVIFDYSLIREEGARLSSSSGKAPGPMPLINALKKVRTLIHKCLAMGQKRLRPIDAYDLIMHASDAVLSGGVRRSATICLFSPDDMEMAKSKTGNWRFENPQRGRSNNSALLIRDKTTKEEFKTLMSFVREFGEPGFVWADSTELMVNPCVEIGMYCYCKITGLSGWQACNLCEINGKKCKTEQDFAIAAKAAAIIGTCQAGYTDLSYLGEISKNILEQEALMGVSITGMMDNPDVLFNPKLQRKMARLILKVNEEIAEKIGINKCARATCVKPAGCQKPDTLVSTTYGILRLDELGDVDGATWQDQSVEVYTDNGTRKSPKFFVNGKQKTRKIHLDSGIILEATENHQYRVIDDKGNYNWKKAVEIATNDVLPFSLGEYTGGQNQSLTKIDYKFNKFTPKKYSSRISQPDFLDEDFAWFLGLYYGDGSNHKRSIRISINYVEQKGVPKLQSIIENKFSIKTTVNKDSREGHKGGYVGINSVEFIAFLAANELLKKKAHKIEIPRIIRMSHKSVIEAFIDGYATADGCNKSREQSYCTTSAKMAEQLVVVLRSIGRDAKFRLMPPTESSYGNAMRYWVQERKSLNGDTSKITNYRSTYLETLNKLGLNSHFVDKVIMVEESYSDTYDIEVEETHCYLANSYISHNTTSCILGTASGIHAHHASRYIRRSQANHLEPPLQHFKKENPIAVEPSVWSANKTDEVISFCIEVPKGAKTKNDIDALHLLQYVKLTQKNWVTAGRRLDLCSKDWLSHNVSNTITVKEDEWGPVTDYIYVNRQYFAGISLLPITGDKDYPQAPFTAIYTPRELVQMYGNCSVMASGLIVDGLHAFENNLWKACDAVLGFGEPIEKPEHPNGSDVINLERTRKHESDLKAYEQKIDWVRRAEQFAERYLDGNIRLMTYCLKDVNNWKYWCDLQREYKDVDYTKMREDSDNTKLEQEWACSGGSCEMK